MPKPTRTPELMEANQAIRDLIYKHHGIITSDEKTDKELTDFDTVYRVAKAYAALQSPAGEWRSMESAPKDIAPVLVFVPGNGEHPLYKGAIYVGWRYRDGEYTVFSNGKGMSASIKPTHWMPLPPAPTGEV